MHYIGEETYYLFTHSSPPFTLRGYGQQKVKRGEERVKS